MTIERLMFPPRDSSRRGFLAVAAAASVASVGALTVAAMPAAVPGRPACAVDPIFAAIEAFKRAAADFYAVDGNIPDEVGDRWSKAIENVLITRPTTPAGLAALTGFTRDLADRSERGDASFGDRQWVPAIAAVDTAVRGMSGLKPRSPPQRPFLSDRTPTPSCSMQSIAITLRFAITGLRPRNSARSKWSSRGPAVTYLESASIGER
jgi:hypothetical protein